MRVGILLLSRVLQPADGFGNLLLIGQRIIQEQPRIFALCADNAAFSGNLEVVTGFEMAGFYALAVEVLVSQLPVGGS